MADGFKFAKRIPRDQSNISKTVEVAYIDIPTPDPGIATSIDNIAAGTIEDSRSTGVFIPYTNLFNQANIYRNPAVSGTLADPALSNSFFVLQQEARTSAVTQPFLTVPVQIERIQEDATGNWCPILTR